MNNFQEDEWANLMSSYKTDFEQGDRVKTLVSSLFQKLNRVLEKKSALFWHVKSYSKEKINPLGLRVQIFPNLDQISTECKKEWEANLNACSQEMMAILVREYNKQIALLDLEIGHIEVALRPFTQHALYLELQVNLRDGLSTYNRGILQKKESKFWRDKTAFSEGRAYRWNTHTPRIQKNKYHASTI